MSEVITDEETQQIAIQPVADQIITGNPVEDNWHLVELPADLAGQFVQQPRCFILRDASQIRPWSKGFHRQKNGACDRSQAPEKKPGNVLLSHGQSRSTIAAEALHFRVRYGNGCFLLAMITGKIR